MLKTYSQAYNELLASIMAANRTDISVGGNTIINDVFIVPAANEIVRETAISDYTQRLQSLDLISTMLNDNNYMSVVAYAYGVSTDSISAEISSFIDNIGSNYNLIRKSAVSASGIVYYGKYTPLSPTDSDISILHGSVVSSANGQKYQVLSDTIMYAAIGTSYFDSNLGLYAIPVPVAAINPGSAGNAAIGSIINMDTNITGMDLVINQAPVSGGTDEETDQDFIDRIKLIYTGNNNGTYDGYKKLILSGTAITDVYVAGARDAYMKRDQGYGGKVDIYILDKKIDIATDIVNSAAPTFILTKQPVYSIPTISGYGTGTYVYEPNVIEQYEGSILASAKIRWLTTPSYPHTINYTYNSNVEVCQNLLDLDVNRMVFGTSDAVLVKQSNQIPVDVIFNIAVFSGYSKASVAQSIIDIITTNINVLKLGYELQQSDIIALAYTIPGLDRITLPMTKFNKTTSSGVVDTIIAEGREYLRAGNILVS